MPAQGPSLGWKLMDWTSDCFWTVHAGTYPATAYLLDMVELEQRGRAREAVEAVKALLESYAVVKVMHDGRQVWVGALSTTGARGGPCEWELPLTAF